MDRSDRTPPSPYQRNQRIRYDDSLSPEQRSRGMETLDRSQSSGLRSREMETLEPRTRRTGTNAFGFESLGNALEESEIEQQIERMQGGKPFSYDFLIDKIRKRRISDDRILDIVSDTNDELFILEIIRVYPLELPLINQLLEKILTEDWYYSLEALTKDSDTGRYLPRFTDRILSFFRLNQYPLQCFVVLRPYIMIPSRFAVEVGRILPGNRDESWKKTMILSILS